MAKICNRWLTLVLLVITLAGTAIAAQEVALDPAASLYPIVVNGKTGFINALGEEIVPPVWDDGASIDALKQLAKVQRDGLWGIIGVDGTVLVTPAWDRISYTSPENKGLIKVRKDRLEGYIDLTGKVVIEPIYTYILPEWSDDKLSVTGKNGRYGVLDRQGNVLIPTKHYEPVYFNEGLAPYKNEKGRWGYIDQNNNTAIKPRWDHAWEFINGRAKVQISGKYGFIDATGEVVIKPQFIAARHLPGGKALVATGKKGKEKWGLINAQGDILVQPNWAEMAYILDNEQSLYWVRQGDLWGLIDAQGEFVCEPIWETLQGVCGGSIPSGTLARYCSKEGLHYLVDAKGKPLTEKGWSRMVHSGDSIVGQVALDTPWQVLDPETGTVRGTLPAYEEMHPMEQGFWRSEMGGKVGLVGADGTVLCVPKWDELSTNLFSSNWQTQLLLVKDGENTGYIDLQGKTVYLADAQGNRIF